jgi:hypothetical protein
MIRAVLTDRAFTVPETGMRMHVAGVRTARFVDLTAYATGRRSASRPVRGGSAGRRSWPYELGVRSTAANASPRPTKKQADEERGQSYAAENAA